MSHPSNSSRDRSITIEEAMRDRLVEMMAGHLRRIIEIGNGPGDATNSIEGSHTQPEFLDRSNEVFKIGPDQRDHSLQSIAAQAGIQAPASGEGGRPGPRHPSTGADPRSDPRRTLEQ